MQTNPIMKKLGFSDTDRVLILHADDYGMCNSTFKAFADLVDFGLVKSGAVMSPCAWYPQAARNCKANPSFDMGVHITLTAEWDSYRWGPLSTKDKNSGLIDEEGYFYRRTEDAQAHMKAKAGVAEMAAQCKCCADWGIKFSHIDTHMGTVLHPKLLEDYVKLGFQYKVPVLAVRWEEDGWRAMGADAVTAKMATLFMKQIESKGMPLHDGLLTLHLDRVEDRMGYAKETLRTVPAGFSRLYIHPAVDTDELRSICPDWKARVLDYEIFSSKEMKKFIQDEGIQLISYREIQALMA